MNPVICNKTFISISFQFHLNANRNFSEQIWAKRNLEVLYHTSWFRHDSHFLKSIHPPTTKHIFENASKLRTSFKILSLASFSRAILFSQKSFIGYLPSKVKCHQKDRILPTTPHFSQNVQNFTPTHSLKLQTFMHHEWQCFFSSDSHTTPHQKFWRSKYSENNIGIFQTTPTLTLFLFHLTTQARFWRRDGRGQIPGRF